MHSSAAEWFIEPVRTRFFKYWLPLLIWMVVIFAASTEAGTPRVSSRFLRPLLFWIWPAMPETTFQRIHFFARKCGHVTEYAVLGILMARMVSTSAPFRGASETKKICCALLFCALYAASDETHQIFVAGREASVIDVLIDTVGASIGLFLRWLARRRGPVRVE